MGSAFFMPTPNDIRNPVWTRFESELQERLDELRVQNDGALDQIKTSEVRGRIAEVKRILALGADARSAGNELHPSDEEA